MKHPHLLLLLGGLLLATAARSADPVRYVDAATLTVIGKALPTEQPYNRIDTTRFRVPGKDTRLLLPPDGTGRRVPHGQPHDPRPLGDIGQKSERQHGRRRTKRAGPLHPQQRRVGLRGSRQTEDQRQERPPRRRNNQQYGGGRKGVPALSAALRPAEEARNRRR